LSKIKENFAMNASKGTQNPKSISPLPFSPLAMSERNDSKFENVKGKFYQKNLFIFLFRFK